LATRLVVMSHGEMVATGTPREIFKQVEMMESIGLGVPEAAKLCNMLRERGIDLPDDLYTLDEVRDNLLAKWKEVR
jgi:ABC-type multidrug transport system ATPase subunit